MRTVECIKRANEFPLKRIVYSLAYIKNRLIIFLAIIYYIVKMSEKLTKLLILL